jgi:hypothetical protein
MTQRYSKYHLKCSNDSNGFSTRYWKFSNMLKPYKWYLMLQSSGEKGSMQRFRLAQISAGWWSRKLLAPCQWPQEQQLEVPKMGVPPIYRPFIDGFSLFNHPAIGVAPWRPGNLTRTERQTAAIWCWEEYTLHLPQFTHYLHRLHQAWMQQSFFMP